MNRNKFLIAIACVVATSSLVMAGRVSVDNNYGIVNDPVGGVTIDGYNYGRYSGPGGQAYNGKTNDSNTLQTTSIIFLLASSILGYFTSNAGF